MLWPLRIWTRSFLPNRKRRFSIQINKLGLFINGNHISAPPRNVALLACLYANLGRVVPYRQLVMVLGYHPARRDAQKHLLRQYMLSIKSTLSAHKGHSRSVVDWLGRLQLLPRVTHWRLALVQSARVVSSLHASNAGRMEGVLKRWRR